MMKNMVIFWSLAPILFYTIIMVLGILGIYTLFLAIKALKIYIKNNS